MRFACGPFLAACSLVAGTVSVATASFAGSAAGATTPSTSSTAVGANFEGQLKALYREIYTVVQDLDRGSPSQGAAQLPSPRAYDNLVAKVPAKDWAHLATQTEKVRGWSSLPGVYHSLDRFAKRNPIKKVEADAKARSAATKRSSAPSHSTDDKTSNILTDASPYPPTSPNGSFPAPPNAFSPSSPVAPAVVPDCPSAGAPGEDFGEDDSYAALISAIVADEIIAYTPADEIFPGFTTGVVTINIVGPNPITFALAVAAGAAHVVYDQLELEQQAWLDCLSSALGALLANIDNTTVNTYELAALMENTLDNVENSLDTIGQQDSVLQQTADDQLTLNIEEALTAPLGSPPNVQYETPGADGGYLDSTPIGVQELVTSVIQAAQSAGLPVNSAAQRYLAAGNAAYAQQSYQQAYVDYQTAFQEAAQ